MKKKLIRLDIIDKIQERLGLSRLSFSKFCEAFFQEIEEALIKEGHVKITSFASFTVVQKKERCGRNSRTRRPFVITPRKAILFHPSRYLRDKVKIKK